MTLTLTPSSSLQITFVPNTADDPARRKPDITKARTLLGWEPKVPLREGLARMVDDFRHRLQIDGGGAEAPPGSNGKLAAAAPTTAENGIKA